MLTQEDNQAAGKTWTRDYDRAGNILSRSEYAYTEGTLGDVLDTISYTHGDLEWGDLLTAYDGQTITHDGIGNPLTDGTWTYTWEHGRELAAIASEITNDTDTSVTYTYNADGLRTGKTVTIRTYEPIVKNGLYTDEDGEIRYYENGVAIAAGLIYVDGYYYYIRSSGVAVRNQSYWVSTTNGLLPAALYDFDEQGRLLDPPVICSTNPDGSLRNGVYTDEDGEIRYYVDGVPTYAGLIYWEGYYYYFNSYAKAVKGCTYWISKSNGLMSNGNYTFDEYGRMVDPPEDALTEAVATYSNTETSSETERTLLSTTVIQYSYVYNGGQLVQMTIDTTTDSETATRDVLYFAYDASGTPMSVTYNETVYYYATNLQGDIVAILDTTGTAVVQYSYDAWGNPLSTTGTLASTLGEANPLRYRGYVYDSETDLYYLQSRYYNPTMGRFINADAYASTGQGLLGNNTFIYCLNNPANLSDSRGTIPFYDHPFTKPLEDFIDWYRETDENETDENGKSTLSAKLKKTIDSLVRNFEFDAGFGVGLGEALNVLGLGFSLSAKYDFIAVRYCDGEWSWGDRITMSMSTSITQAFEFGAGGVDSFRKKRMKADTESWLLFNNKKDSWTLFGFENYMYFLGGSIEIGYDLNTCLSEVTTIWEE